ncbi:Protein deltexlike, partial [Caligus rogercresseyi]
EDWGVSNDEQQPGLLGLVGSEHLRRGVGVGDRPGRWRPYSPQVTQLLERAHHKNSTLSISRRDPLLSDYYINMRTFEQCCDRQGPNTPCDGSSIRTTPRQARAH